MSDWPRVIEATGHDVVTVDEINGCVSIMLTTRRSCVDVTVNIEAAAALIAAITDAAKVVTGEKA